MHLLTSSTIIVFWMLQVQYLKGNDFGHPRQLTSISGDTIIMECNRTIEGTVDWKVHYDPDDILGYICNNGRVTDKYRPRVELDPHNYTLTIHDVMVNDSGRYYCVDSAGRPDFTRLDVVLPPPGQLRLVNRTETSLAIYFNQTGRVTGYSVSVNGRTTSDVTYSGIGRNIVTATVDNLIPGSRYSVSAWSSRNGIYSKTSTRANYSTVPAAPGVLHLVNRTEKCLTISWNQRGRVTDYELMLDNSCPLNTKYFGVGTEFVTAVLCCLSIGTKYTVSIMAVRDEDKSQATSGDFETLQRPPSVSVETVVSVVVPIVCLLIGCAVGYVVYHRLQGIQQKHKSFIEFNQSSLREIIAIRWKELLENLQKNNYITKAERLRINLRNNPRAEVRGLVSVLKYLRRPKFNIFIKCLQQIGHQRLASAMAAGEGVLVAVDIEIANYELHHDSTILNNFKIGKLGSLGNDVTLVEICKRTDFRAYFHCKNSTELHRLQLICTNQELRQKFRELASPNEQFYIKRTLLNANDYYRCVQYLTEHIDTPLDESQLLHLNVNLPQLTELIDCDSELLTTLVAKRSISPQQKDELNSVYDKTERNRKLMEILKHRSVAQLHRFAECLATNHTGNLSPLILEKGVIVNVDSTLDETSVDDVNQAENQIVSRFASLLFECDDNRRQQVMSLLEDQFKNFLQKCDVDIKGKLMSMLEEFQEKTRSLGGDVDLVALKKQNSIGSYFFCRTYESLQSLQKLYENGELCQLLELIFTTLFQRTGRVCIKTHQWIPKDYGKCVNYLQTLGSSATMEGNMNQFQFLMEVLEMLLLKTVVMIFIRHLRTDGHVSEAYRMLSSVCSDWWQTLNGWPQSDTKHWVRHRLQRLVKSHLVNLLDTKCIVNGLTQFDAKIFVLCCGSDTIRVFGLNNKQLQDIQVKGLEDPRDIVACSESRSLYVADLEAPGCVWRVSTDGRFKSLRFLPTTTSSSFIPWSLSVTSDRLLVTTRDALLVFGADGVKQKSLSFTVMSELRHAVETSRGTFVFCHMKPQPQVVQVDGDGRIISVYNDQQKLAWPSHLSIDSEGNMFIADQYKHHILLMTSDLQLDRVLLDKEHNQLVKRPLRLFYVQQTRQLLVGSNLSPVVQMFAVG